jgi:hypothetical protein
MHDALELRIDVDHKSFPLGDGGRVDVGECIIHVLIVHDTIVAHIEVSVIN